MPVLFEETTNRGRRGLATVQDLGTAWSVQFQDGYTRIVEKSGGLGTYVEKVFTGPNLFVELNSDETQIWAVRPYAGVFNFKFDHFTRPGDSSVPTYKVVPAHTVTTRHGGRFVVPETLRFTAILRIADGPYEGATYPFTLQYMFYPQPDGNLRIQGPKSPLARLRSFLLAAGFDPTLDTLTDPANVLPELEELLKERSKVFQGQVKEGWVTEVWPLPDGAVIQPGGVAQSQVTSQPQETAQPQEIPESGPIVPESLTPEEAEQIQALLARLRGQTG